MSARIEIGSVASKEAGVLRVDAAGPVLPGVVAQVTLTVHQSPGHTVSPLSPAIARGLAQLLNAAADRAEKLQ